MVFKMAMKFLKFEISTTSWLSRINERNNSELGYVKLLRSFEPLPKYDEQFLPRDAMHPRYQPWACLCLCLSVCLSVCHKSEFYKNGKTQDHTNNTTRYPRDSSFLTPKISAKFDRGHPLRERRMQVGWVKIGDFPHISGYISKTVKDRHIVSITVE